MKSSLKKSLYIGLAAASMLGAAGLASTTASAKSSTYLRYYQNIANKTVSVTNQNATVYTTGRLSHKAGTMRSYGSKVEEYYAAHVTKNGKASVYYKFRVGKKTGWVWHGYLKSNTGNTGATTPTTPTTPASTTTPTTSGSQTTQQYKPTSEEMTSFYKLKNPGPNTLITSSVVGVAPASQIFVNMPDKTSSADLANDVFFISEPVNARASNGDIWYQITDVDGAVPGGWINANQLEKVSPVSPSEGVTVNFVDQYNQKVNSVVVPFGTAEGHATMNLAANFDNFDGLVYDLSGYTDQFDPYSSAGFANNPKAKVATKGMTFTFPIAKTN